MGLAGARKAFDRRRPEGRTRRGVGAGPCRTCGRAAGGVPARGGGAPRRGARCLSGTQRTPRLRPDDGLGSDRPACDVGGARHRLHSPLRHARPDRAGGGAASSPAEPDRRLRRRRPPARPRGRVGGARGAAHGGGPGCRRRHGRRGGFARDDDLGLPRTWRLEGRARHEPARHRRAVLRGLRVPRTDATWRSARIEPGLLRGAARGDGHRRRGPPAPDGPHASGRR